MTAAPDGGAPGWPERLTAALRLASLPERIASRIQVDPATGCWLWTGCRDQKGYGEVSWQGHVERAHRVVWRLLGNPLPANGVNKARRCALLDHGCLRKACCNPEHLELVTVKVNTRRHFQQKKRSKDEQSG